MYLSVTPKIYLLGPHTLQVFLFFLLFEGLGGGEVPSQTERPQVCSTFAAAHLRGKKQKHLKHQARNNHFHFQHPQATSAGCREKGYMCSPTTMTFHEETEKIFCSKPMNNQEPPSKLSCLKTEPQIQGKLPSCHLCYIHSDLHSLSQEQLKFYSQVKGTNHVYEKLSYICQKEHSLLSLQVRLVHNVTFL